MWLMTGCHMDHKGEVGADLAATVSERETEEGAMTAMAGGWS